MRGEHLVLGCQVPLLPILTSLITTCFSISKITVNYGQELDFKGSHTKRKTVNNNRPLC